MTIADSNTRTQITIDKKIYEQVKSAADTDGRSINNWIIQAIKTKLEIKK